MTEDVKDGCAYLDDMLFDAQQYFGLFGGERNLRDASRAACALGSIIYKRPTRHRVTKMSCLILALGEYTAKECN